MVIQRWQTLMLLIAAVMMSLFSFCSLGQFQGATQTINFTALGMSVEPTGASYWCTAWVFVCSLLSVLLSIVAIFRFKNPKAQRKVCWLTLIMVIASAASAWLAAMYADVPGSDGIGWSSIALTPFIALVALIVAIRCIGSDIKKLSSYDRLR